MSGSERDMILPLRSGNVRVDSFERSVALPLSEARRLEWDALNPPVLPPLTDWRDVVWHTAGLSELDEPRERG